MQRILMFGTLLVCAAALRPATAQTTFQRFGGSAVTPTRQLVEPVFASHVVSVLPGSGAGGLTSAMLGGPRGAGPAGGSLDVYSLGDGGSATLGFDVALRNGPGADLIVFENGLSFAGGVFSEVVFVEVSSDGTSFARFQSSYAGPVGPLPPFGSVPMGTYRGLAGGLPVIANVVTNGIDPFDPTVAGGESFDLEDLQTDPLVRAGTVDLSAIRFVRLVDVVAGSATDSNGTTIWDNGAGGGADIDAVCAIQHEWNDWSSAPVVDLWVDAGGFLNLVLHDSDGLSDVPLANRRASLDLVPMSWATMESSYFTLVSDDGFTRHLRSPTPIDGAGQLGALSLSARDRAGGFAADQFLLQG